MNPNVAVIVICYNDAARLPRAVASATAQSLANLEVIIVDDYSTDDTAEVAARLAAKDGRVRYHRLPANSGGCSAPRNAGIELARAPYVMFLDSDDELPRDACRSLARVLDETGADFVSGRVERYYAFENSTRWWYQNLFQERRVIEGIRAAPEYLFDHLSTNKMYRRDFIERHQLRFPLGVHWEDQLWSAQAYCLAERFAVVPWPAYKWWHAGQGTSISSSTQSLTGLVDRITVARLVDDFLVRSGNGDLRVDKDFKFLRHDLKIYLTELSAVDLDWVGRFAELIVPYLDQLDPAAYLRLNRAERVCVHLLRRGRLAEAAEASRQVVQPEVPPRRTTTVDGRTYWGAQPPADDTDRRELDVTAGIAYATTLAQAPLWHDVVEWTVDAERIELSVLTRDPAGQLAAGGWQAWVRLNGNAGKHEVPLALVADPGGGYAGTATIDLSRVPLRRRGLDGPRPVSVVVRGADGENVAPLWVPGKPAPVVVPIRRWQSAKLASGKGRHLTVYWQRSGPLVLDRLQAGARRRLRAKINAGPLRSAVYRGLIRLVPVDRRLAVFEADEGRGYAGNPRYVFEELRGRRSPIRGVWSRRPGAGRFPSGVPTVQQGGWRHLWTLARAGYWVDSHGLAPGWPKRSGTRYLQTWHGQPVGSIGFDAPRLRAGSAQAQQRHRQAVARWDLVLAPSAEFERVFPAAHGYRGALLAAGCPRNDVLVRAAEPANVERAEQARRQLRVPPGRRVLLYAPTRRAKGDAVRLDLRRIADALAGEWVVVVRPHPATKFKLPGGYDGTLRDGRPGFADVNDLLLAADVLVTDYSSIMVDFATTGRPILLFADDYDAYRADPGTYLDLRESAPGPVLASTDEVIGAVRDLEAVVRKYDGRYQAFRTAYCSREDGAAAAAVVDGFFN